MENVEAAVGENDPFLVRACVIDRQQQLLQAQYTALGALFTLNGPAQFRGTDGRGTQLADHNARRQVGQSHRMRQLFAGSNRCRQGRDHRITSTGHIEHFAGTGRQMQRLLIRTQQGHAMFATGHQQRAEIELLHQLRTLGDQLRLIDAMTDDGLEFAEVRRDQAGTAIDREVLALGVGQHRNAALAGGLNQRLMVFQCALAVIRQDQHLDAIQQAVDLCAQGQRVSPERFFEIDTQQLLVATHDTQFDDGRLIGDALKARQHTSSLEAVGQTLGSFVIPRHTDQRSRCAQRSDVQGHVGSATRTVLDLIDLDHRYWRFRGNTRGTTMPVSVEHDIAHHQDRGLIKARHG